MSSFKQFNLSKEILESITKMGYKSPTEIQAKSIPALLQDKDLVGLAQTGTGKTAAFAIPIIEKIKLDSPKIQALILAPTRELTCQIQEQFELLSKHNPGYKSVAIYGGQNIETQKKALKNNPQIIVASPGRLLDHFRQKSLDIRTVERVVLDEADKMLEMGFQEDLEKIFELTKKRKQTTLFSATMQGKLLKLAHKHLKKAISINLIKKAEKKPKIEQSYYVVKESQKIEALKRLASIHRLKSAIVFCNTRSQVDEVFYTLKDAGFSIANLHGGLDQRKRDAVMRKFRSGEARILVTTDIASRGIDVDDIEAVFNLKLPRDSEDYVHRIGRTGRAGKEGLAFSILGAKEVRDIRRIAEREEFKIKEKSTPPLKVLDIASLLEFELFISDCVYAKKTYNKYLKKIKKLKNTDINQDELFNEVLEECKNSKPYIFGNI